MERRTLLTGLALLAFVLPLRADTAPAAKPVTVPFELFKTKHIGIMVKINGKGPYRVIFDTGSPVTLLSNKVAEETGLLDKKAPKPLFNPFGAGGEAKIKTLEVGGVKVENVPAIIMDHPGVEAMSKAFGGVEGIVGFPFFARYKMTIDYQATQLTLVPNGFTPPDTLESMMNNMMAILQNPAPKVLASAGQWGLVVAKSDGDDEAGVSVKEVRPGSAAAAAGLRAGDRLLTLDGRWTDTLADAYLAAGYVKAGTPVKVVVRRDGKEVELTVTPVAGL
jgi:membrane-associated protease RseP (regulator of RpoE activity)